MYNAIQIKCQIRHIINQNMGSHQVHNSFIIDEWNVLQLYLLVSLLKVYTIILSSIHDSHWYGVYYYCIILHCLTECMDQIDQQYLQPAIQIQSNSSPLSPNLPGEKWKIINIFVSLLRTCFHKKLLTSNIYTSPVHSNKTCVT